MAASGFTPIQLYYSTVSGNAPVAGGLLDGELAINTAEGKLYYKNSSGVVTLLAGISGYSGISGFSGISGYSGSGISGYSGFSGSGVSGYSGFSGISGYSGANGTSGFSGISGYSGLGISGYSGFSGATGAGGSGTSGTSGYSGFSGISGYSGSNGSAGTSGFSGFSGATGANGTNGTSGYSGFSGTAGASGYSGATGPTTYPGAGIAVSTGSAWGTSLADPLVVSHGGTGLAAVTAGYVPFGNSSTALGTSSLFNWSTANVRLGVGIAAPVATLHVRGGNSNNAIVDNDGSQYTSLSWYNNGTEKAQGYFDATNVLFVLGTDVAAPFIFKANATEGMRLSSGGGVSIGTSTSAGAGNLLVNGTVTASNYIGPGTGLTGTAASLNIGGNAATATTASNGGVTSIAAGTGISVSGATGAVTVTNTSVSLPGLFGQVFTSNGTFTIPTGVTAVKVTVVGGGGSGAGVFGSCCGTIINGNSGGTSSVSSGTQTISTVSATGGGGGNGSGAGGLGSGGDLNINGNNAINTYYGNLAGGSLFSSAYNNASGNGKSYGGGSIGGFVSVPGGGGGGTAIKYLTGLTPSATITVTRGAGGAGINSTYSSAAGGNGVIIFEW